MAYRKLVEPCILWFQPELLWFPSWIGKVIIVNVHCIFDNVLQRWPAVTFVSYCKFCFNVLWFHLQSIFFISAELYTWLPVLFSLAANYYSTEISTKFILDFWFSSSLLRLVFFLNFGVIFFHYNSKTLSMARDQIKQGFVKGMAKFQIDMKLLY